MSSETTLQTTLRDCLTQQMGEIEVLQSIYSENEIIFTDTQSLKDISEFLNNRSINEFALKHVDFIVNLYLNKHKIEINVNFPSFYPIEDPNVHIRCNKLNRQQESSLNSELSTFLINNREKEVCIYSVITWVQENFEQFSVSDIDAKKKFTTKEEPMKEDQKFSRLWIFSHHIYNKRKREEIVSNAKEFNLTGFCLPGKPGIICIEGNDEDCKEWWKIIKSMTWKKIMIRKSDTFEQSERSSKQKFKSFEEIHFQNPSSKHSKHADMSEFSKYIEVYGLINDFNEFFGLCNS